MCANHRNRGRQSKGAAPLAGRAVAPATLGREYMTLRRHAADAMRPTRLLVMADLANFFRPAAAWGAARRWSRHHR